MVQVLVSFSFGDQSGEKEEHAMDGNPYSRFVAVVRGESETAAPAGSVGLGAAPARMRLGIVTQREPLKIRVAGIEQPTQALRINERLVKGDRWTVRLSGQNAAQNGLSVKLTGAVDCPGGCGSPQLSSVAGGSLQSAEISMERVTLEQLKIDLAVGDQVLLLTEDDQIFFILMKVVQAV